jgi:hypothetical protein
MVGNVSSQYHWRRDVLATKESIDAKRKIGSSGFVMDSVKFSVRRTVVQDKELCPQLLGHRYITLLFDLDKQVDPSHSAKRCEGVPPASANHRGINK